MGHKHMSETAEARVVKFIYIYSMSSDSLWMANYRYWGLGVVMVTWLSSKMKSFWRSQAVMYTAMW